MRNIILAIIIVLLSFNSMAATTLQNRQQLLLALVKDEKEIKGSMQRYQRDNSKSKWISVGKPILIVIGKNGLARGLKKEGDLRTPQGIFAIHSAFGFAKINTFPKMKLPYQVIDKTKVCVDDSQSKFYNQIVNSYSIARPDWKSAEQMNQVPQYKWGAFVEYNTNNPLPNAGSCIFLHIWRNAETGTAGCIAMSESDLKQILYWLNPEKHPAIAIISPSQLPDFIKQ